MPFLIAGLLILWLASAGLKAFVRANPAALAGAVRRGGGLLAMGAAVLVLLRGRLDLAMLLGGAGFWLATGRRLSLRDALRRGAGGGRGRRVSRVRSAMIEMELDHGSGTMTGCVLAGPDEGAALDGLSRTRCLGLHARCLRDDPEGARLLEAYLDRRFPDWRQAAHEAGDPGGARASDGVGRRPGAMSEEEAHQVLGLPKSATREDVTRAHRALMKKLHPDHGGSTSLAARVNEAKDVLMRRHP